MARQYSVGFKAGNNLVIVTAENAADLDKVIDDAIARKWVPFFAVPEDTDALFDALISKGTDRDDGEEVDFCPVHGSRKKWADTRDGGHYCGEKVLDNKWCGYKEDAAGKMLKPPRTLPNYVKF